MLLNQLSDKDLVTATQPLVQIESGALSLSNISQAQSFFRDVANSKEAAIPRDDELR